MTREEAVARIKDHIEIHRYHERNAVKIFEALDMAIKALKQPEPCEDAVSRETVKEQMLKYGFRAPDMTVTEFVEDCLPSVTPKQRTGKWIKLDMHRGMADHKCTACEQECYVPTCMGEPMYAFFPNCGAKMEVTE